MDDKMVTVKGRSDVDEEIKAVILAGTRKSTRSSASARIRVTTVSQSDEVVL